MVPGLERDLRRVLHVGGVPGTAGDRRIAAAEVMTSLHDHCGSHIGAQRSADRVLIARTSHAENVSSAQLAQLRSDWNGQIVRCSPEEHLGRNLEVDLPVESEE